MNPILYAERVADMLTEFVHANGDYLFMGFVFFCLLAIGWLLSRRRKSTPPTPSSARTRAIIGTMLASPDLSSDADGGRTRLIMGDTPGRRAKDLRSNWP